MTNDQGTGSEAAIAVANDGKAAPAATESVDVVVLGAGIAGVSAAAALAQAGVSVAIVDFREHHPPEFRAEKIGDRQVGFFESFGLGDAARRQLTSFEGVWVHRYGRVVERSPKREYSSAYGDLVNAVRDALPATVRQLIGRVTTINTSDNLQRIELADGRALVSRLLVVATGLGEGVLAKLGIERRVISPAHSLAGGFDLANPASDFPFTSLAWVTEEAALKTAYVTVFPMGDRLRGNIFFYRAPNDPWTLNFRRNPEAALHQLLPGFEPMFGRLRVDGASQVRPIDLSQVTNHRQPGVVLIGDAFFVTCPVTGTGMDKALNDADRLREHVPEWLATPGMAAAKIEQFYDDPAKVSVDASSLEISLKERDIRVANGLSWRVRRLRRSVLRRSDYRLRDLLRSMPTLHRQSVASGVK